MTVTDFIRPYFITRARDTDAAVRIAVFRKIATEIADLSFFSMDDRLTLLHDGLKDRYAFSKKLIRIEIPWCDASVAQCYARTGSSLPTTMF